MLRFGIFLVLATLGCFVPQLAAYPAAVSPLVALAALLGGQITLVSLVALLLAAPSTVNRRFFCRIVCPLGFCFTTIGKFSKNRSPQILRGLPNIGVFLALWTLLVSVVGGLGFLWLDPLVLFASPFRNGLWLLPVLGSVFVLALLAPTFWCRAICPLGGTQDILYVPKALKVKPKVVSPIEHRRIMLRWGVLAALFGGVFVFLRRPITVNGPIRPPGAPTEPYFLALCSRCGTCVQVCPTKLLTTDIKNASLLDSGTPRLQFDPAWCRNDCIACTQSCPSGALKRIEPNEKKNVKIGLAVFEFEFCRLYEDIECSFCGRDCPFDAIFYEWSEEEYRRIVKIDNDACIGCGRCIVSCPVKGADRPLTIKKFIP